MTTITTQPTYAVPNKPVGVKFTKTNAQADYLRVWVTDAPIGSKYRIDLDKSGQSRMQVHEGDNLSVWRTTELDKGGTYRLTVQEYTRGATTYGGAYEGDPNAAPSEAKVSTEYSLSLSIGQRMVTECGVGGDTASLICYVWDATIRPTNLEQHGEVSPAIIEPTSPRASSAVASTAVRAAVTALENVTAATAIGTVASIVSDFVANWNLHLPETGVHDTDDTHNSISNEYAQPPTPATLPESVSHFLDRMRRHFTNDGGLGPGTAGTDPTATPTPDVTPEPYHDVTDAVFDYTNMPLFDSVGGTAEAYRALADIWRAYEAHRVSLTVHDAADATNALAALPLLLDVHKEFFTQLAAISPTVPDTQSTAAVLLMAQTGAIETTFDEA